MFEVISPVFIGVALIALTIRLNAIKIGFYPKIALVFSATMGGAALASYSLQTYSGLLTAYLSTILSIIAFGLFVIELSGAEEKDKQETTSGKNQHETEEVS